MRFPKARDMAKTPPTLQVPGTKAFLDNHFSFWKYKITLHISMERISFTESEGKHPPVMKTMIFATVAQYSTRTRVIDNIKWPNLPTLQHLQHFQSFFSHQFYWVCDHLRGELLRNIEKRKLVEKPRQSRKWWIKASQSIKEKVRRNHISSMPFHWGPTMLKK